MHTILRRLRGAVGLGVVWGVTWAFLGWLIGTLIGIFDPDSIDPGESPLRLGGLIGVVGLCSGLAFSVVLSLVEKRKSLQHLSLARVAAWGMLGSAAVPLLTTMPNELVLLTAPLGALLASGTVALARRSALREPAPPNALEPGSP